MASTTASSSTSEEDQKVPTLVFNHQSSSPNLAEFDSDNEDPTNQVNICYLLLSIEEDKINLKNEVCGFDSLLRENMPLIKFCNTMY